MIFTSLTFVIFLAVVLVLYWFVFNRSLRIQNLLVLAASYFFYGWWDWRFLSLIVFSSMTDYLVGLNLFNQKDTLKRKILAGISIAVNLGLLGFFKYYNFFIESANDLLHGFGLNSSINTLRIILPVGISFYTFQTLSYTIDIYRGKLEPTKDIIAFFAFVSFFPQLVAGPVERGSRLMPQFIRHRTFDTEKAKDGLRQMLWGFFKKIVIADTCGQYVDPIFANYSMEGGSTLLLGVLLFTFQIYADFSAYSDIAIGTARLLGFNLMQNFAYPNFSRDPGEYWRRWHISLSTWFRDYIYIPLGGSKTGKYYRIRNIIITFVISGFWHGANWTFVLWGLLNGLYYIPLILFDKVTKYDNVIAHNRILPTWKEFFQMVTTFLLITMSRIFFRSPDVSTAFGYYKGVFSSSFFILPEANYFGIILLVLAFVAIEWVNREKKHPLEGVFLTKPLVVRWAAYYSMLGFIYLFYREVNSFIYFQF